MPETPSKSIVPSALLEPATAIPEKRQDKWVSWVLPSISDIFFLVLLGLLGFSSMSAGLLGDADTGWHIRNGEVILATRAVPRVDPFSYTKAGQPWYAWEWLYDAVIGGIHHFAGLNGVVLFSAVVIAATFALLFRFVLRRCGSFVVAAGLTLLGVSAAQVHILARPHILSWLFTLLWVEALYRFEEGQRSALLWLPPLMLLWVNVHGGFILGLVLIALFGCSRIWAFCCEPGDRCRRQILDLTCALGACMAVTLLTPYGYKLHIHVYQYLSNSFLMNSINEFMSPNFHAAGFGYFELFILLSVVAVALAPRKLTATDLLVLLFSMHAGLFAARNIPLAAIMMCLVLGPALADLIAPGRRACPEWVRSLLERVHEISANMGGMERQFRGHALVLVALAGCGLVALNGGRVFSTQLLSAHFDEGIFPVMATEVIAQKGVRDGLFSPDYWSGYLIYKLYPATKLCFDDRHDFYGEQFVRDYLKTTTGDWRWREMLDKNRVKWALIPAGSPLSSIMKESNAWRLEYDDGIATIFSRN
jgi:hypothetical protein